MHRYNEWVSLCDRLDAAENRIIELERCFFPGGCGIEVGDLDSSGELRLTINVEDVGGWCWISREFWEAMGAKVGWSSDDAETLQARDAEPKGEG